MNREKFPEKVPFRLTRMMTKAMEVSGIEGNFRSDLLVSFGWNSMLLFQNGSLSTCAN
jgi:phosphatidylinositol kinase/protein kinase (PI-3  family)